ncbi:MAG: hypothetical protein HYR85_13625 [Planctomycetes bacterium]|nr:hypothetical protein [Planctomycetota bacterium]
MAVRFDLFRSSFAFIEGFLVVASCAAARAADVDWALRQTDRPPGRISSAMVYDSVRHVTVHFAGSPGYWPIPTSSETWEWNGRRWQRCAPSQSPSARHGHSLAFDEVRGRVLLFGGVDDAGADLDDTWEWDGTNWQERHPDSSPPGRAGHAMVFDAARGRIVLFGGESRTERQMSDTWEWDGENWIERHPASVPPPRRSHYLAFDSARHRTVLYGGFYRDLRTRSDVWEWDGNDWTEMHPTTLPFVWDSYAFAFDAGLSRTVLFGRDGIPSRATIWLWDGHDWTPSATPGREPRDYALMVYDSARRRLVTYGGSDMRGEYRQDTWEWDGATWTLASPDPLKKRTDTAIAFDSGRGRAVLFGGNVRDASELSDTWEWDGSNWQPREPVTSPPARSGHAMAFDSVRRKTVLFGGKWQRTSASPCETWEWDGDVWRESITERGPIDRVGHSMTFDSRRGHVVLFGGSSLTTGRLGDTWEWDGDEWLERTPVASPSPRWKPALAYDPDRGVSVLFGGADARGQLLADTWEWNGTSWRQRYPETSPSARFGHSLAYDALHRRMVLFGGGSDGDDVADTWAWDGSEWTRLVASRSPDPRGQWVMAFDDRCGEMLALGGMTLSSQSTWSLGEIGTSLSLDTIVGSEEGNDLVAIDGFGFTDPEDTTVAFGTATAHIVDVSCRRVLVRTPPGTGQVDVALRNSFGNVTHESAFRYVAPHVAARFGNVGAAGDRREDVLLVDGNVGDLERDLTARVSDPLWIYVTPPSGLETARFVLYAWVGEPDATTLTALPRGLGSMIFPTPFAGAVPQPRRIWNNVGRFARLGLPTSPSSPAPSLVLGRSRGPRNPAALAFQGLVENPASLGPDGFSVTNAVVLHVVP